EVTPDELGPGRQGAAPVAGRCLVARRTRRSASTEPADRGVRLRRRRKETPAATAPDAISRLPPVAPPDPGAGPLRPAAPASYAAGAPRSACGAAATAARRGSRRRAPPRR